MRPRSLVHAVRISDLVEVKAPGLEENGQVIQMVLHAVSWTSIFYLAHHLLFECSSSIQQSILDAKIVYPASPGT